MIRPAICCIGYNRPDSMMRLLNSIGKAKYQYDDITLIISIDYSDKSEQVKKVADEFSWKYGEKKIVCHEERLGLREHCLLCGDYSMEYDAVIFLEDDVVLAKNYYNYVVEALEYYKNDDRIIGISLYSQKWVSDMQRNFVPATKGYDTFFLQRDISHGQCWIGNQWKQFRKWFDEHDGHTPSYNKDVPPCVYRWKEENSWSKFMSFYLVEKNKYYVCPYISYATDFTDVGIHASRTTDISQVPISEEDERQFQFGNYDKNVIYDAIFERKDCFFDKINGINFNEICIDLNGMKYDWSGYSYILTSKMLPYEVICSYGANMEPIENNIIYQNVCDNTISLYKIPISYKSPETIEDINSISVNPKLIYREIDRISLSILLNSICTRPKQKMKSLYEKINKVRKKRNDSKQRACIKY